MGRSVRAPNLGMEYQTRWFWNEACGLFLRDTSVTQVSLESQGIKAFDDVVTRYRRPRIDAFGRSIDADHFQLKFHVDGREVITSEDLTVPSFIGAKSVSLLQRVHQATAKGELPARLSLVTAWEIDQADTLHELVSNRYGEISIDRLFGGEKRFRLVREQWAGHLELDNHDQLLPLLRHFQFWTGYPLWQLDRELNNSLRLAGLRPVDESMRAHPYDGMARRFIDDGPCDFDITALKAIAENEGLWVGLGADVPADTELAIKSFRRFAARTEDVADTLDLIPAFVGRHLSTDVTWSELSSRVQRFLEERVEAGRSYSVHLDCHASLAFAAGAALQKAAADVAPVQKGQERREVWRATEAAEGPQFDVTEHSMGEGPDAALAVAITHDVERDVLIHVNDHLPQVGRVIVMRPRDGVSQAAVRDANHALAMANELVATARQRTDNERLGQLLVFAAAPNSLLFFMGKVGGGLGPTTIYEFAFEENKPGGYSPGITL